MDGDGVSGEEERRRAHGRAAKGVDGVPGVTGAAEGAGQGDAGAGEDGHAAESRLVRARRAQSIVWGACSAAEGREWAGRLEAGRWLVGGGA